MARRRLIAGIAFAGLGLSLFLSPSHGFSQRPPETRADTPAAAGQNPPDAGAEAQAAIAKYCTTCHNERSRTAGLALDPAGAAHPGEQAETWEKVLRQLRAGTANRARRRRPAPRSGSCRP